MMSLDQVRKGGVTMTLKPSEGKPEKDISGNVSSKTTGKIDNDIIPAKDKNPDDMEIVD